MIHGFDRGTRYHLVAGDTGLGKTATAIRAAMALWDKVNEDSTTTPVILVVTDASVQVQLGGRDLPMVNQKLNPQDVWVIDGDETTRMVQLVVMMTKRPMFVITNYDTVRLELAIFQEFFSDNENNIILLDEADRIQNMGSQRSIAIRALEAAYKVAMTATPVANRANTLYPILQFLAPGDAMLKKRKWGKEELEIRYHKNSWFWGSEADFLTQYCTFDSYGRVNGSRNLPDLHRRLQDFGMSRWIKRELTDLPPIVYEAILVDGTPTQWELYNRMKDGFIAWMEDRGKAMWSHSMDDEGSRSVTINNIIAQLMYLRRATTVPTDVFMSRAIANNFPEFEWDSSGLEFASDDSGKALWLKDYCEQQFGEYGEIPEDSGMFVWSQWTDMVDSLDRTLAKFKPRTHTRKLDGSCDSSERFRDPARCHGRQLQAAPILTGGGRGMNFQKLSTAILTDLPWTPPVVDQAIGRVDRIGQQADR